jgi:hypothetical protein
MKRTQYHGYGASRVLREIACHCGHADILREQILTC